jgi:hypothetical protein
LHFISPCSYTLASHAAGNRLPPDKAHIRVLRLADLEEIASFARIVRDFFVFLHLPTYLPCIEGTFSHTLGAFNLFDVLEVFLV